MKYILKIVKKDVITYMPDYTSIQDLLSAAYAIVAFDPKNTQFFILEDK